MTDSSDEDFFALVTQSAKMLRRKKTPLKPRRRSEPKINLNFSFSSSSDDLENQVESRNTQLCDQVAENGKPEIMMSKKSPLKDRNDKGRNSLKIKLRYVATF